MTFGFIVGYLLLILFMIGWYFAIKKKSLRPIISGILVGFLMYILMLPFTLQKMNNTTASYQELIGSGKHLNSIEKFNIYGLNITMALVAYPLFPEVSKEALYMMIPSKNGEREFRSDFFMKSKLLKSAFHKNQKGTVKWSQKHYHILNPESRVALALNSCDYEIIKTQSELKYKVTVPVTYPIKSRVTFLKNPIEIRVEEGLFRYLEDEGWLFGYDAVWIHYVKF